MALIPTVLGISFYQLFNIVTTNNINQVAMAVQIILLYLPLIYLASIMLYKLYKWRRPYKKDDDIALELDYYIQIDEEADDEDDNNL